MNPDKINRSITFFAGKFKYCLLIPIQMNQLCFSGPTHLHPQFSVSVFREEKKPQKTFSAQNRLDGKCLDNYTVTVNDTRSFLLLGKLRHTGSSPVMALVLAWVQTAFLMPISATAAADGSYWAPMESLPSFRTSGGCQLKARDTTWPFVRLAFYPAHISVDTTGRRGLRCSLSGVCPAWLNSQTTGWVGTIIQKFLARGLVLRLPDHSVSQLRD